MALRVVYFAALPETLRRAAAGQEGLEQQLAGLVLLGQKQWPGLELDGGDFATYLGQRCTDPGKLDSLPITDLYLTCACAAGSERAVAALVQGFMPTLERTLLGRGFPPATVSEALQALHEKLLVPQKDQVPRIVQYQGRVKLLGWLRVSALRTALDLLRKTGREVELRDEPAAQLEQLGDDPELQYLRRLYRDEFREAFEQALGRLSVRERNVLRLQVIDGLATAKIGAMYGVDARTVRRWLERSREQIATGTREALIQQLEVNESECRSIMRLVQSQIDITLRRLL